MPLSSPATNDESPLTPSTRTLAVQRCRDARAQDAYLDAMPDLAGHRNIRDFIACVAAGVLSGDISPIQSPGYLYAAQVAISALRLEPKDKPGPAA